MQIFKRFMQLEAASAIILLVMAIISILLANSPWDYVHAYFIDTFLFTINEGLMTLFFLMVGLELKRGFLEGDLSNPRQIALPGVAALGGMVVPALIYLAINYNHPDAIQGWSTPVATDIAFALGALSLLGKRVPNTLKLFLLALAIFDDIGAIVIITLFYSEHISWLLLGGVLGVLVGLYLLNHYAVKSLMFYLLLGAILWSVMVPSGIHPTLGGVLLALFIPDEQPRRFSPLHRLENALRPWVAYFILPLFALANAGFAFGKLSLDILTSSIVIGIMLGLFVGKQIGIMSFTWLLVKLRVVKLPRNASWLSFYGVAIICGIGFTMSLFLGTLSFQNDAIYLPEVRIGVILGSLLSGLFGILVLRYSLKKANLP